MMQQLAWYDDDSIDEERAIEKFFHVILEKCLQVAITIETLMEYEELTIEDVVGRLKVIDLRAPQSRPPLVACFSSPRSSGSPASESGRRGRLLQVRRAALASADRARRTRLPRGMVLLLAALVAVPTASTRPLTMTLATTVGGPAIGSRTARR